jgi:hypothetical protein
MRSLKDIFLRSIMILAIISLIFTACSKTDDAPPILTLNGNATVDQVLNQPYKDAGAKAIDETDGDISNSIYIESNVNVDLLGEYAVTYKVVDEAGNEAEPVTRTVRVINMGYTQAGNYTGAESMVYPDQDTCTYSTYLWVDSTVNKRLVFYGFACNSSMRCFFDVVDTTVVIPFQQYEDSLNSLSVQGSGWLNDSIISVEYTRKSGEVTSYWNATFKKY